MKKVKQNFKANYAQKVKQIVKQNRKSTKYCLSLSGSDILCLSQRSSGVEQRFRKPPVDGSNPFAGSTF